MASSATRSDAERRIDALVDRAIAQHVGVGGEDEDERSVVNFKLCKRYCDYHLRVHRYRDRSAEEVREEIETILERMRVASQDDKATFLEVRMEKLLTRWDATAEANGESDVGAKVALLLLRLSRRPLTTTLEEGARKVTLGDVVGDRKWMESEDEARDAAFGDDDGGRVAAAVECEGDDAASTSTLSVWSDDSDVERDDVVGDVVEVEMDDDDPGFSWRDGLLKETTASRRAVKALRGTSDERGGEKEEISQLIVQARRFQDALRESNAQRGDAKLLASASAKMLPSETSLVNGALHALRTGCTDFDRVSLPHLSSMTLDGALMPIHRVAAILSHIQKMTISSASLGPTIQAFAQALMKQASKLMEVLRPLEKRMAGESSVKGQPTLLELRATIRGLEVKVDSLEQLALEAFPLIDTPAAEAASHCLSTIYDIVTEYQAAANIDGFAIALPVFVDTIQPYLQGLHRWLSLGILDDPSEELLVARGRAADDYVGSKEHWLHGYVLRHDIETPCFLREFMTTILDVGRSLVLLHHTESQTSHTVPNFVPHLSESFCQNVRVSLGASKELQTIDDGKTASENAKELVRMSSCASTLKQTNILNNPNPISLVGLKGVNTKEIRDNIISHPTRIVAASRRRLDGPLQGGPRELNSWLEGFFASQVPACPIPLLIQKSIGSRIKERARDVQGVLSKALRDDLDIKKELYALRAVFLGGAGDAAMHFFTNVFDILDNPAKIDTKWNSTTLNELLIDAFAIDNSGEFPEERGIQVEIIPEAEQNLFSRAVIGTGSLEKIASLRYSFDIKWPHNIVISPSAMSQYNAVAVFLGQLRRAHAAMQSVMTARWSARIRRTRGNGLGGSVARHLEPRLRHFVTLLRTHVVTQILSVDWQELMKKIDDALTLDAMRVAHDAFLDDATKRCLVSPDPTWTLLAEQIRTILAVACEYAACQTEDGAVSDDDATRLSKIFEDAYGYIERVLQAKLDIGSTSTRDAEELLLAIKLN